MKFALSLTVAFTLVISVLSAPLETNQLDLTVTEDFKNFAKHSVVSEVDAAGTRFKRSPELRPARTPVLYDVNPVMASTGMGSPYGTFGSYAGSGYAGGAYGGGAGGSILGGLFGK